VLRRLGANALAGETLHGGTPARNEWTHKAPRHLPFHTNALPVGPAGDRDWGGGVTPLVVASKQGLLPG